MSRQHGARFAGVAEPHRPDEAEPESFADKLERLGIPASPETLHAIATVDASSIGLKGDDRLRVMALISQARHDAANRPISTFTEVAERQRPARGTVYFLRHGQHIKIGFTTRTAEQRLAGLQLPPGASIVAVMPQVPNQRERDLHRVFAQHRVKGEWFSTCPELEALIRKYAA